MMKPRLVPVILTAGLLVLQSCVSTGSLQRVPVTSNPVGARIIVDGEQVGSTPLNLSLSRDENHVIRIEKDGYAPAEIRVESRNPSTPLGKIIATNLIWVPLGLLAGGLLGYGYYSVAKSDSPSTAEDQKDQWMATGAVIGLFAVPILATVLTVRSETKPVLTPATLHVVLDKAGDGTSVRIVRISGEDLRNVRWIRILCPEANALAPARQPGRTPYRRTSRVNGTT